MQLIHCSYHKCLTVLFARVFDRLYNRVLPWRGYQHFNSHLDDFYTEHGRLALASVNNHALDFDRLRTPVRITRFIRDPRDLVVSGYFYHRRAAEAWCSVTDPTAADWRVVNGTVPDRLGAGQSYASYLTQASPEEGLMAEIDFRAAHFASMAAWPDDPRIRLFRYEDSVGREAETYAEIFEHYGLPTHERLIGRGLVRKFSLAGLESRGAHIRNPSSGQWREHFTPAVEAYFMARHGALLDRLGYR
jgi:hypothetical protein